MTAIVSLSTNSFKPGQAVDVTLLGGVDGLRADFAFGQGGGADTTEPWFSQVVDPTGGFSLIKRVPAYLPLGTGTLYVTLTEPATDLNPVPGPPTVQVYVITVVDAIVPGKPVVTLSTATVVPGKVVNVAVSGGTPGTPVTVTTPRGFVANGRMSSAGDAFLTVLIDVNTPVGQTHLDVTVGTDWSSTAPIDVTSPTPYYYNTADGAVSGAGADGRGAWGTGTVVRNIAPPDLLFAGGRWRLWDPNGDMFVYEFPLNPQRMTSPLPARTLTPGGTTAVNGQTLLWEGADRPYSWEFSGVTRGQDMYLRFAGLAKVNRRFYLGDHRGRVWIVTFEDFDAVPKRNVADPWYHEYTMRCTIYGEVPAIPESTFTSLFAALVRRYF